MTLVLAAAIVRRHPPIVALASAAGVFPWTGHGIGGGCCWSLAGGPVVVTAAAQQRRPHVFAAAAATCTSGPIHALHGDVSALFARRAKGNPPLVSSAQLVQMLFEVGAADVRVESVGEVVNSLMIRGFYRLTRPEKRDSAGAAVPPGLGLDECKRWATTLFLERFQRSKSLARSGSGSRGSNVASTVAAAQLRRGGNAHTTQCQTTFCGCPIGPLGARSCVLSLRPWECSAQS